MHRALSELARVVGAGGRLIAATNGVRQLAEVCELAGRDLSDRWGLFSRETGEELLRPHFADVRRTGLDSTIDLTADDMRKYVKPSFAHKHLATRSPSSKAR